MYAIRQFLILMLIVAMPAAATAQIYTTGAQPPTQQQQPPLPPQQLDQMVAPIALYPDPLIAQILMASTYPLEIVEAQRWLSNPANAGLQGDNLAAALEQQPWDPSVKSLVPFPQVLHTLNDNLEWTEQLGNAFLAQQADVMNAVQHLRWQARQAGHLQSTPQQVVETQGQVIEIEPANPEVVYVPYYDPTVVYGAWPYPSYRPYYFSDYPSVNGAFIGFAVGVAVIAPLWGWNHWDWRDHRIAIDNGRFERLNEGHAPPRPGQWEHQPDHRHGVPYASPQTRANFAGDGNRAALPSHADFRGYDQPQRVAGPRPAATPVANRIAPQVRAEAPRAEPARIQPQVQQQHAAPVFESFSRGQDVRQQQQRGEQSRPAPQQAQHAQAPHPQAQAAHGGGDNQEHERH